MFFSYDFYIRLDVAKSIHQLVAGFTTNEQITRLRNLVSTMKRSQTITSKQSSLLDIAIDEAVYNVNWNQERLVEVLEHMRLLDFLTNSASQKVVHALSFAVCFCTLLVAFQLCVSPNDNTIKLVKLCVVVKNVTLIVTHVIYLFDSDVLSIFDKFVKDLQQNKILVVICFEFEYFTSTIVCHQTLKLFRRK